MSFRCKGPDAVTRMVQWRYINRAWLPASTVCSQNIFSANDASLMPRPSNFAISMDELVANLSWTPNQNYWTYAEIKINDGNWIKPNAVGCSCEAPGTSRSHIDFEEHGAESGDTIRVRIRFGDGIYFGRWNSQKTLATKNPTLYFSGSVNSEWNTLGNWWRDEALSEPATHLPTSIDKVVIVSDVKSRRGNEPDPTAATITLQGNAEFRINIECNMVLNDQSSLGGVVTGNVIFNDDSYNFGTVNGNATFNDDSWNESAVEGNATFTKTGYVSPFIVGSVSGTVTFENDVVLVVQGEDEWSTDASAWEFGGSSSWVFNDLSSNNSDTGSLHCTFNDYSTNYYGGVVENATFNDSSFNYGVVNADAEFNDSSCNSSYVGNDATFNDESFNADQVHGDATFNDNSSNFFGSIYGSVTCNTTGNCP